MCSFTTKIYTARGCRFSIHFFSLYLLAVCLFFFCSAHTRTRTQAPRRGGVRSRAHRISYKLYIQYTQDDTLLASKSRLKIAPKRLASSFSSHRIEAYNHKTFLFRTHAHALSRLCRRCTHTHARHTVRSVRSTRERIEFICFI